MMVQSGTLTEKYDTQAESAYAYGGNQYVSYDNKRGIITKVSYDYPSGHSLPVTCILSDFIHLTPRSYISHFFLFSLLPILSLLPTFSLLPTLPLLPVLAPSSLLFTPRSSRSSRSYPPHSRQPLSPLHPQHSALAPPQRLTPLYSVTPLHPSVLPPTSLPLIPPYRLHQPLPPPPTSTNNVTTFYLRLRLSMPWRRISPG
jgi:hypothetical protein